MADTKPYDASLKELVERGPGDWLDLAGMPRGSEVRVVDGNQATVDAAVDKALLVEGPQKYIAHIEFQAGPDPDFDRRMMWYNVLLRRRHEVPVRSVAFLMSRRAVGRGTTGRYVEVLDPPYRIEFGYQMIRAWELSPDSLLTGGVGTVPLAALAAPPNAAPTVFRKVADRLHNDAPRRVASRLIFAAYVIAGLRHDRTVLRLLQQVSEMRDSLAYQMILEEGEARGAAREAAREARRILLRLGSRKFGPPDDQVRASVRAFDDAARLELLVERVLEATSWSELLASPPAN